MYDDPAGMAFQLNPPRLNSDATKFGGSLGVVHIAMDIVFRQFIEQIVAPIKVPDQTQIEEDP
eukprot:TRINITY_DN2761_c0_g1_i1.p2 TRINITY_DN2761_c0_g1~~TRINITY_DN2761_c0_g1_i1.p2  ORF type:complete len:63 (+),score=4.04 TRINITY_DN2761_c0_g1_i1:346-534(+)